MKKIAAFISLWILATTSLLAQVVNVDSLDKSAETIVIPKCRTISSSFKDKGFDKLKSVTFEGIDYLPSSSFEGLPNLEEVIFNGDNLNIGGAQYVDLPKLRRVIMNGNTFLVNGSTAVVRCPEFEEFEINGLITYSEMSDPYRSPNFKNYSGEYALLYTDNSKLLVPTQADQVRVNPAYVSAFATQLSQISGILADSGNNPELAGRFLWVVPKAMELASALGVDTVAIANAYKEAKQNPYFWTKLETLQHSPAYAADTVSVKFTYQPAGTPCLEDVRMRFNIDSVAGDGDDISKIKNLTYWVHDIVRHDGSSYNPVGPKTLANIVDTCRQYDRGVNCRMMAIILTEALLSEGIPARYLTCQPKDYENDPDCHVICVAWSDSLNKWVWADPTFAAFVTDENGLMLHPGEVRARLIANEPLILNEDANWNHKSPQTKKGYLDHYMAKNLYYITAITDNRQAPEGGSSRSTYVTLSPVDSDFKGSDIKTTDFDKFWQAPE